MKKYLFTGAERTGKSTNMLMISKLLTDMGKKVIDIDTTYSQGIGSFFYVNKDIENKSILVRENFEIMLFEPYSSFNEKELNNINLKNYDYVFFEGDITTNINLAKDVEKIFLFQDNDRSSLIKNKLILKELDADASDVIFVFNNILNEANFDAMFLLNELVSCIKVSNIEKLNENIEIPFNEEDIMNILTYKIDGRSNLRCLSKEYKNSLYMFINLFEDISEKEFKKLIGGNFLCN